MDVDQLLFFYNFARSFLEKELRSRKETFLTVGIFTFCFVFVPPFFFSKFFIMIFFDSRFTNFSNSGENSVTLCEISFLSRKFFFFSRVN